MIPNSSLCKCAPISTENFHEINGSLIKIIHLIYLSPNVDDIVIQPTKIIVGADCHCKTYIAFSMFPSDTTYFVLMSSFFFIANETNPAPPPVLQAGNESGSSLGSVGMSSSSSGDSLAGARTDTTSESGPGGHLVRSFISLPEAERA